MKEIQVATEIKKSIQTLGHWAYKIPDMPSIALTVVRFMPDKPFDIVSFIKGWGVGIEVKLFKKFQAFGIRHLMPSQIQEMDKIVDSLSGQAFVFLNIRISGNKEEKIKRENRLIILNWKVWGSRLKRISIKKKELEEFPFVFGKKGLFDLKEFCSSIVPRGRFYGRSRAAKSQSVSNHWN